MDSFPKHNPKQASRTEPTIEEIKEWDGDELLEWIQQRRPKLLKGDHIEKLSVAYLSGEAFLMQAGNVEFFKKECNLPIGPSLALADLASRIVGEETASIAQKGKEQDTSTDPKTRKRKNLPYTDIVPSPKRIQVGNSSLIINGELKYFQSGLDEDFSVLLRKEGQAYFDRTRYILKLHELHSSILFCRPRRFGKSVTVSMLEHFHGLQYAGDHRSLYKGLSVQKDIDEGKVIPGQYFVLTFDFSIINSSPDLIEANKKLTKFLNSSLEMFYGTYTAYLGGNFADLCQKIDSEEPNLNLQRCALLVQNAIKQDERLTGIEGIYVLVDEYDAFPNNFLELNKAVKEPKIAWEDTAVGRTFKSFWATIKYLGKEGIIRRIFVTGISPLSLCSLGSAFNVTRNVSFDRDLAGLCGLTYSDLKDAMMGIEKNPKAPSNYLMEMTKFFNGYHFCKDETVGTVYNTETCLAYLQRLIEGKTPEAQDPQNSEVSEHFLRFAVSAPVIRDFEKALKHDEEGNFLPLGYGQFKSDFTLKDLSTDDDHSSWRSLIVYFGGLTFHPKTPTMHLKIPNKVAADRIALAVLRKYDLRNSFEEALQHLIDDGELERTLGCYQELMIQRDVTDKDLTKTDEASHRDSFYFCLLRNHFLIPHAEFKVIKQNNQNGRIDLIFQVPGRLIVTEWKFYRINFLDIHIRSIRNDVKANALLEYKLPEILRLGFNSNEKFRHGTIKSWVIQHDGPQLRSYIKSTEVQQLVEKGSLELRAHLVIVVGSRHILLWDMDKEGNLATEPHLVEVPSRLNRQDGRGYYS